MNQQHGENMQDALIECIGRRIAQNEVNPGILNLLQLKKMQFSHAAIKHLTGDRDVNIICKVHQPFKGTGSICIEGERLEFRDCKWFSRAIEFANNVEAYPLTNGKVRFVLTFHGLIQNGTIEERKKADTTTQTFAQK